MKLTINELIYYFDLLYLDNINNNNNNFLKNLINLSSIKMNDINLKNTKIVIYSYIENLLNYNYFQKSIELLSNFADLSHNKKVLVLGNLKKGQNKADTIQAVKDINNFFLKKNSNIIIFTDSSLFITYVCKNYETSPHNISEVTSYYDIKKNLFKKIGTNSFFYNVIGLQQHLISQKVKDFFQKRKIYEFYLSEFLEYPLTVEPLLRDSNVFIINTNSIINNFCNDLKTQLPNGFTAQDLALMSIYCAQSELNNIVIFYLTSYVEPIIFSQIIWYYSEYIKYRCKDYPLIPYNQMKKIDVKITEKIFLTFLQSPKTQRLWFEIPINNSKKIIVSCSEKDFNLACNKILPIRWLKILEYFNT